jgi:hypothetical protein
MRFAHEEEEEDSVSPTLKPKDEKTVFFLAPGGRVAYNGHPVDFVTVGPESWRITDGK